jgi:uncharacterized Fe-S cluster-containing radical SAM superfamily protein
MTATQTPLKDLPPLDPRKFRDPDTTAKGERRASVGLKSLDTLWINTGTLCNLTCANCYIESSPTNDRLVYLSAAEVAAYLDEIAALGLPTQQIGFTGGEPFMNPDFMAMVEDALGRGFEVLVLTNAMKPMMKRRDAIARLATQYGARLVLRVSIDHYSQALHELERGKRSWQPALDGLLWLVQAGVTVTIAGRTFWRESEAELRAGYARLFREHGIPIDADDHAELVLFPEMDAAADVPEITEACWGILNVSPDAMMCATSRMVVKRKGAALPVVVPCTLLPYDEQFDMGPTLAGAQGKVKLNHPHCAKFCVLGGGSCTVAE